MIVSMPLKIKNKVNFEKKTKNHFKPVSTPSVGRVHGDSIEDYLDSSKKSKRGKF